jgi:nitrogen fixation/metabolism regulation signal transduction histidine kinase
LKVTPLTNWDIWWALTIPAVRSLAVLLIYGIVFSSILATVGREPPENRWRELSGDDYAVQSLLAVGLLSLIVAGSLLLVFVRRSGKAGPLLFARVVVITVMAGVLVLFFVWIPWAWGFDSSVGSLPQRVLLFVGLAYLPYFALRGVPRDIDGLFDESART